MIQIRPVSDLRNKFNEIENVEREGQPVYLTKNGYGTMVVMSIEAYSRMTENTEMLLDIADKYAAEHQTRYSHEDVFKKVREKINE